jgi:hypothetical protein
MKSDIYTKVVLTIIAACLLVLTFQRAPFVAEARAANSMTCTGELKANAWGGIKEMIGGYKIQVECE